VLIYSFKLDLTLFYRDDGFLVGDADSLRGCWTDLTELGREIGYYPQAAKTKVYPVSRIIDQAGLFSDLSYCQALEAMVLGAPIGSQEFMTSVFNKSVDSFKKKKKNFP